jgi:hypothetical protein
MNTIRCVSVEKRVEVIRSESKRTNCLLQPDRFGAWACLSLLCNEDCEDANDSESEGSKYLSLSARLVWKHRRILLNDVSYWSEKKRDLENCPLCMFAYWQLKERKERDQRK